MTGRERVWAAIRFQHPDRIPIIHGVLPGGIDRYGAAMQAVLDRYPSDFAGQGGMYGGSRDDPAYRVGENLDEWGCLWRNLGLGTIGMVSVHPLADWSALDAYRLPGIEAEDWPGIRATIAEGRASGKYVMAGAGRLFERMHFLRGYERLLLDIAEDNPNVVRLRDLVLEHDLALAQALSQCDLDAISYMDDWGTQNALVIRPALWRRLFKPAYRELVDVAHRAGMAFYFHSDGCILDIIPDLIEIGVDVINPQFSCHDLAALAALCRGRVCVATDMDRQHILPHGTPEQARQLSLDVIAALATPEGGLIGRAEVGPDTPPDNIAAVYDTFTNYRWE